MRLTNVQTLRALAANGVLAAHIVLAEAKYGHGDVLLPRNAELLGFAGVDLFFVISGFIMVMIADRHSWRSFLVRRAARIYPPYWLYTTVVLVISLGWPTAVNSSLTEPPSVWRSYLLVPDDALPVLAVGWTLVHEMYFYVVFALLLFLRARLGLALPHGLAVWAAGVAVLNLAFVGEGSPVLALVSHPLTFDFLAGAAAAFIIRRTQAGGWLALGVGASAVAAVMVFASPELLAGWGRVALLGLPAALVVYGAAALEQKGAGAPAGLVALGDASYSLYLSHVLVISALGRIWSAQPWHGLAAEAAFVLACFAAANVWGLISHRLVERPLMQRPPRTAGTPSPPRIAGAPPPGAGGPP